LTEKIGEKREEGGGATDNILWGIPEYWNNKSGSSGRNSNRNSISRRVGGSRKQKEGGRVVFLAAGVISGNKKGERTTRRNTIEKLGGRGSK